VEGSVAFLGSVLVSTIFLWAFGAVGNFKVSPRDVCGGTWTASLVGRSFCLGRRRQRVEGSS
jgi:hypothetical protein